MRSCSPSKQLPLARTSQPSQHHHMRLWTVAIAFVEIRDEQQKRSVQIPSVFATNGQSQGSGGNEQLGSLEWGPRDFRSHWLSGKGSINATFVLLTLQRGIAHLSKRKL